MDFSVLKLTTEHPDISHVDDHETTQFPLQRFTSRLENYRAHSSDRGEIEFTEKWASKEEKSVTCFRLAGGAGAEVHWSLARYTSAINYRNSKFPSK